MLCTLEFLTREREQRTRLTLVASLGKDLQDQIVVAAVWRAKVERLEAKDPDERLLDFPQLIVDLVVAQHGQVGVGPGVGPERVLPAPCQLDRVCATRLTLRGGL